MTKPVPSFLRSRPTPPEFRSTRPTAEGRPQPLILNPRMRAEATKADLSEAHDRIDRLFASL